jgi:hypothetical protein
MSLGLCLAVATSIATALPVERFTLSWTHSVEKVAWEEDWRIDPATHKLVLEESRLRGSGAGMDPPDGAVLRGGIWHGPGGLVVPRLRLALSEFTEDWRLCTAAGCKPLLERVAARSGTVELFACPMR